MCSYRLYSPGGKYHCRCSRVSAHSDKCPIPYLAHIASARGFTRAALRCCPACLPDEDPGEVPMIAPAADEVIALRRSSPRKGCVRRGHAAEGQRLAMRRYLTSRQGGLSTPPYVG